MKLNPFNYLIGNHKPPFFLKFTYSKLIKLSLEVCDRFTALLHISNQPRFAAGNFKLFQTCLILRKLDVSDPNITTGKTNKSAHIGYVMFLLYNSLRPYI